MIIILLVETEIITIYGYNIYWSWNTCSSNPLLGPNIFF